MELLRDLEPQRDSDERNQSASSRNRVDGTDGGRVHTGADEPQQLALKDLLPWEYATSGRRRYRRSQIEVISHARQIRWHPVESD